VHLTDAERAAVYVNVARLSTLGAYGTARFQGKMYCGWPYRFGQFLDLYAKQRARKLPKAKRHDALPLTNGL